MECPICARSMGLRFAARDLVRRDDPREYELYWCDSCSFGTLGGQFTPETVAAFYEIPNSYYTRRSAAAAEPEQKRSFVLRALLYLAAKADKGIHFSPAELKQSKGSTVCEIGCGNGTVLSDLARAGFASIGIEPDVKAKAFDTGLDVRIGTAEQPPSSLAGRQFDAIVMLQTLEHCICADTAVRSIRDLIKPNGTVVIEVPNNAVRGFGPTWSWLDVPRHLQFFTEASLRLLLEKHGLRVTRVQYVGYWRRLRSKPSWLLLLRTILGPARAKYDSLRVHATPMPRL